MANEPTGGNGNGSSSAPIRVYNLRMVYLQDVSFEAPHAPGILFGQELQPELKFQIESSHRQRDKNAWEVLLHASVHATAGDKSLFLVEVKQGGLFEIAGFTAEETMLLLKIKAPEALYPYVAELISSLVSRGGFPRLQLQPINFEALYAEARQARAQA